MARGRDAAVAISTSFGPNTLAGLKVGDRRSAGRGGDGHTLDFSGQIQQRSGAVVGPEVRQALSG
jgi:hypothetical protein